MDTNDRRARPGRHQMEENIGTLNQKFRWELDAESVRQEVTMGSLRVDLLADASWPDGQVHAVVIENQFGVTDASHLAGMMAYLAAFEAKGAVWIAESVSREYADIVQWLNDETEIDAYLFTVEAIRIDESRPVPIITKVVGPSVYPRGERRGDPDRNQRIRDWWSRVLPKVSTVHDAWRQRRPTAEQYGAPLIPNAPGPVHWYVNVRENDSSVGVWIRGKSAEEGIHYYDLLHDRREEIEDAFGEQLVWKRRRYNISTYWISWQNPRTGGFDYRSRRSRPCHRRYRGRNEALGYCNPASRAGSPVLLTLSLTTIWWLLMVRSQQAARSVGTVARPVNRSSSRRPRRVEADGETVLCYAHACPVIQADDREQPTRICYFSVVCKTSSDRPPFRVVTPFCDAVSGSCRGCSAAGCASATGSGSSDRAAGAFSAAAGGSASSRWSDAPSGADSVGSASLSRVAMNTIIPATMSRRTTTIATMRPVFDPFWYMGSGYLETANPAIRRRGSNPIPCGTR